MIKMEMEQVQFILAMIYAIGFLLTVIVLIISDIEIENEGPWPFLDWVAVVLFSALLWFLFWPAYYFIAEEVVTEDQLQLPFDPQVEIYALSELLDAVREMQPGERQYFRFDQELSRELIMTSLPCFTGKSIVGNFVGDDAIVIVVR